jgi:5'-nucleotidase
MSRIIITNDDGIDSPGIQVLALEVQERGHDVLVAAPAEDQSGASASIWRMHSDAHVDVLPVDLPEAPGVKALSVAAPPGLIVLAASLEAFGAVPDFVLSGINAGLNTGRSILHSGTVGAVLTAQRLGFRAMAVSLGPGDPWQWAPAAKLAADQLSELATAAPCTALNLNVPSLPDGSVPELRVAELDTYGSVRAALADGNGQHFQIEMRTTGEDLNPESDAALVARGYATLTTITGVQDCPPVRSRSA